MKFEPIQKKVSACSTRKIKSKVSSNDNLNKHSRGRNGFLFHSESARKRNRGRVLSSTCYQGRICIGNQFERWNELMAQLNVSTHAEVVKILLNKFNT